MGRFASLFAAALVWASPAIAQDGPTAAAELNQMCHADARALWGVSLCGPLMIADPASRTVWASESDHQGLLRPQDGGWVGVLPADVAIANTALDWAGLRWAMVIAPLPEDAQERRVLLAHEAWHRVQGDLGFFAQDFPNAHLATARGRTLLRLEMRALATALRSSGVGQRRAMQDALILRAARHAAFAPARAEETALDRHEGLAAYTGVRLGAADTAREYALRQLDSHDRHENFARAYAYATGPAYGVMLDQLRPRWRTELGGGAPADLLAGVVRPEAATPRTIAAASARYGAHQVAAEENARAEAAQARLAALRAAYTSAYLEAPLTNPQFAFDPNQVTPIADLGTHYQTLTLRDAWGELRATEGAIIAGDFSLARAAAPRPDGLSGPGWTLTLAPGWRVAPPIGASPWRIERAPPTLEPIPQPE